jgi:hypothetical protein
MRNRKVVPLLVSALAATLLLATPDPTSSEECGTCHRDIWEMWRASAHSRSLESQTFRDACQETADRYGDEVANVCLGCHAPMLGVTGDTKMRLKVTWEGVNCDVCHGLVSVDLSGRTPTQVLEIGSVKHGPIKDAHSTGHDVAYSELHTQSLVCAGCHEYVNPEGVSILATFSEWKASSYAKKGETCQNCHMGRTAANIVDPRVARVSHATVNIHEVPGGHSLTQLNLAVGIDVDQDRQADRLILDLTLENKGAGHAVPTGMPGRRMILELKVQSSSGQRFEEQRVYGRFMNDKDGNTITKDGGYFGPGITEESDSRLQPDESRKERFEFPVSSDDTVFYTIKLHYEHSPLGQDEGRTRLTFYTTNRTLPAVK